MLKFSRIVIACLEILFFVESIIWYFQIGDIQDGSYKLHVTGTRGLEFTAEFPLEYVQKSYSVYIQTDRAVYQPGSTVMFRAIVLNPALKPAAEVRNEPLHIHIEVSCVLYSKLI